MESYFRHEANQHETAWIGNGTWDCDAGSWRQLDSRQDAFSCVVHRGPGWAKLAGAASVGWFIGSKFHVRQLQVDRLFKRRPPSSLIYFCDTSARQQCRRQKKKLESKFKVDQKALYQQYYEDVYSLQIQNSELISALEQLGYKVNM